MVTFEEAIKMMEALKAELITSVEVAQDVHKEWFKDRDLQHMDDGFDAIMAIENFFNHKIAEAAEKLAETKVVTTMSAGVSLLTEEENKE